MTDIQFNEELHKYTVNGVEVPSVTQVCSLLSADKYGSLNQSVLWQAQQRGTAVHELCELYDYDALPDEIDPTLAPYLKAYAAFCRDYNPDWLAIEKPLYSKHLNVAGRVDRIGMIDGKSSVVDIKTTAGMDRTAKLSLACQLSAYADAWEEEKNDIIFPEDCIGVQLKKDGTYTIHRSSTIFKKYVGNSLPITLFENLRELYRIIKGV